MKRENIIIIGGGIGGLAAGCYLQRNGYKTRILEMGHECGGVSVPWKRGEYLFDGATNWVPGSSPGLNIHNIVREVIDFSQTEVDEFDEFMQIEDGEEVFHVYTDLYKLKDEMLRIAPEDERVVNEFINAVFKLNKLQIPFDQATDLLSLPEFLVFPFKNRKLISFYFKWKRMTIHEFAQRFTNKHLRIMFQQILPHHNFFSLLAVMMPLSWMHSKSAGYLKGGSRFFIDQLEDKYGGSGGEVLFKKKVSKINVKNNSACGVFCEDGSRYDADIVLSAADRYETINYLLEGRYTKRVHKKQFSHVKVFPAMFQISLGVARAFDGVPHKMVIPFSRPLELGSDSEQALLLRTCNFDTCYAPSGKTALVVHLRSHDWNYWVDLRNNDLQKYKAEKQRILDIVIKTLDERFGEIKDHVEITDVATPATYIRYTNVWKGSYQGWAPTPPVIGKSFDRAISGLKNFYFTGQWLSPAGGLPRVIVTGRQVAQRICREDHGIFKAG